MNTASKALASATLAMLVGGTVQAQTQHNCAPEEFDPCGVPVVPLTACDRATLGPAADCAEQGPDGQPIGNCCPWSVVGWSAVWQPPSAFVCSDDVELMWTYDFANEYNGPIIPCGMPCIPSLPLVIEEEATVEWNVKVCPTWSGNFDWQAGGQLGDELIALIRGSLGGSISSSTTGCVEWTRERTLTFSHGTPQNPIMIPCGFVAQWRVERRTVSAEGTQAYGFLINYHGECGSTPFNTSKFCQAGMLQGDGDNNEEIIRDTVEWFWERGIPCCAPC
jgi:hypothetical protein